MSQPALIQNFVPTPDVGYEGFEKYSSHASIFRPAALEINERSGGLKTLSMCSVGHPVTDKQALGNLETKLAHTISKNFGGQISETLRPALRQNRGLRETIAAQLERRMESQLHAHQLLVLPGSSTYWLDILIKEATRESIHRDWYSNRPIRMPVVLAAKGSFKCGGFFPFSNGARLSYVQTDISMAFKMTPTNLEAALSEINTSNSEKACCLIIETPTAFGQNWSRRELLDLLAVLKKFPDVMLIQDCYNHGTEHSGKFNPIIFELQKELPNKSAAVFSFRRDWGGIASYAPIAAVASPNKQLIDFLGKNCSREIFYSAPQFTLLHEIAACEIAQLSGSNSFLRSNQELFCELAMYFSDSVKKKNAELLEILNSKESSLISAITIEAGQFGFMFFNKQVCDLASVSDSAEMAELMALYEKCRILPTILNPMGLIGNDPVGVRLNIALHETREENFCLIDNAVDRVGELVAGIMKDGVSRKQYEKTIDGLYKCQSGSGE